MGHRLFALAALAAGLSALAGCGDGGYVSVSGLVTLDGEPLPEANVSFLPENPKDEPAGGVTDESGRFTLTSNQARGVKPGRYKVLIESAAERPAPTLGIGQIMAAKYEGKGGGDAKTMAKDGASAYKDMVNQGKANAKRQRRTSPPVYADANKTPLSATVPQPEYKFELHKDGK